MELKEYLALKERRANRKRPKHEESKIQIAVANYLRAKYPGALFTIAPSGINVGARVAGRLKAMGYQSGTLDLLIFEPRGRYNGFFLELKTCSGKPSVLQNKFIKLSRDRGYYACIAYGYAEAISDIDGYLNLGEEVK